MLVKHLIPPDRQAAQKKYEAMIVMNPWKLKRLDRKSVCSYRTAARLEVYKCILYIPLNLLACQLFM
jgi:hypothetical protein